MLKRAVLMLLIVPVQMFNFFLARNFLHGLHSHSQEVVTEDTAFTERTPCLGSEFHSRHLIVEPNRVVSFGPEGQISVESTLSEGDDSEEITNEPAQKVDVEESACSEEGCENP